MLNSCRMSEYNDNTSIQVRAGQDFALNIPVSGEPPPEITWSFGGKPLETDDRVKINNEDYRTKVGCVSRVSFLSDFRLEVIRLRNG